MGIEPVQNPMWIAKLMVVRTRLGLCRCWNNSDAGIIPVLGCFRCSGCSDVGVVRLFRLQLGNWRVGSSNYHHSNRCPLLGHRFEPLLFQFFTRSVFCFSLHTIMSTRLTSYQMVDSSQLISTLVVTRITSRDPVHSDSARYKHV